MFPDDFRITQKCFYLIGIYIAYICLKFSKSQYGLYDNLLNNMYTVNSEIFARILFSRNFAYVKFREKKNPREMAESLCRFLMQVNLAQVANF